MLPGHIENIDSPHISTAIWNAFDTPILIGLYLNTLTLFVVTVFGAFMFVGAIVVCGTFTDGINLCVKQLDSLIHYHVIIGLAGISPNEFVQFARLLLGA